MINTREAAARLAVPARELYRLIDVGVLRAYNAGRDLHLRADEVDAFGGARPSA
ncbi:MAG: excisionase family DNA-binding protein [Actinomycetota bacterium]|nr:excisionase family DNA-binding protein [Actinomycetota bacterium]